MLMFVISIAVIFTTKLLIKHYILYVKENNIDYHKYE